MGVKSSDEITLGFIVDIVDTTTYYKLQDATLDPPDVPTTETPTGWSETEPEYDPEEEGKLYSVTKTTFTDGTFSYSEVSLSSSFKAANQAFVKALLAQDTADGAAEEAGNASTAASAAQATANQAKTAASTAQTTANDAAKVATNFLAFEDGTGLVVGDMTEATLGANTLISANGVAIRDGETELAAFTKNSIGIGKTNPTASIDVGSKFQMRNRFDRNNLISTARLRTANGNLEIWTEQPSVDLSTFDDSSAYILLNHARVDPVIASSQYYCPHCYWKLDPRTRVGTAEPPIFNCPNHGNVQINPNLIISPGVPSSGRDPRLDQDSIRLRVERSQLQNGDPPVTYPNTDKSSGIDIEMRRDSDDPTNTLYGIITLEADRYKIYNPSAFMKALSTGKYAAISVSYPAGAYCYCENEELGILYEATDTVGEYTFPIPQNELGTWKITIVRDDATMTKTVTLSEDERTAHVDIMFRSYVVQYGVIVAPGHTTSVGTPSDTSFVEEYSYNGAPCLQLNVSGSSATVHRALYINNVQVPQWAKKLVVDVRRWRQPPSSSSGNQFIDISSNRISFNTPYETTYSGIKEMSVESVAGTAVRIYFRLYISSSYRYAVISDMWFE